MKLFVLFLVVFASKENNYEGTEEEENKYETPIVKIEEDEYVKGRYTSRFIGVSWNKQYLKWQVCRRSRFQDKIFYNGSFHAEDETVAAHASDTLARMLMKNGEKHKLNFPGDYIEVWREKKEISSKFIGVHWNKMTEKWQISRRSKIQGKLVYNGCFNLDEERKAAHASDTLARDLIQNGETGHKLNFLNDKTEVWREKKESSSNYIGVYWHNMISKWEVKRWSKHEKKSIRGGGFNFEDEIKAAYASDTLARDLMKKGESQKLNFPNNYIEVWPKRNKKRKRNEDIKSVL